MGKTALIYNPYFDTLGGGEKYSAAVIYALINSGYQVNLAWKNKNILSQIKSRFDIDLTDAHVDQKAYIKLQQLNMLEKLFYFKQFDLIFWVSDGSMPLLNAKKNLLHFQVPFKYANKINFINNFKLSRINQVICNSNFTKLHIDKTYGVDGKVLYPPCQQFQAAEKQNIILAVGRFDGIMNNKRQDVLINAFKTLNPPNWKLVLAGGNSHGDENLKSLKQQAKDFNIEFLVNPDFKTISQLYSYASLFWHAAGYEVNTDEHPENVEHFGISTVEAMSAKAVPLVYNAGGQREIIQDGINGYVWNTIEELCEKTNYVLNNQNIAENIAQSAAAAAKKYSMENFINEFTHTYLS